MMFIHHQGDSEREQKPPEKIRRIGRRLCEDGGPALTTGQRGFVSAKDPQLGKVMAVPDNCGSNYWEIVVEATDL